MRQLQPAGLSALKYQFHKNLDQSFVQNGCGFFLSPPPPLIERVRQNSFLTLNPSPTKHAQIVGNGHQLLEWLVSDIMSSQTAPTKHTHTQTTHYTNTIRSTTHTQHTHTTYIRHNMPFDTFSHPMSS